MRRPPPSWALLVVAAALFTAATTWLQSLELDSGPAWLMLGAALTLAGQWSAIEVYHALARARDKEEAKNNEPRSQD